MVQCVHRSACSTTLATALARTSSQMLTLRVPVTSMRIVVPPLRRARPRHAIAVAISQVHH
jgi:hypothetical protein